MGEVDVLVVLAVLGLGGRGEDRFGELGAILQPFGQADTAHRATVLILLPPRTGEVAAHDALDREHVKLLDDHRAALHDRWHVGGDEMVGHDVGELIEPPQRDPGEHLALVGNLGAEDVVVGADAIRGDHEQPPRLGKAVQTAHLSFGDERQIEGIDRSGHGRIMPRFTPSRFNLSLGTPNHQVASITGDQRFQGNSTGSFFAAVSAHHLCTEPVLLRRTMLFVRITGTDSPRVSPRWSGTTGHGSPAQGRSFRHGPIVFIYEFCRRDRFSHSRQSPTTRRTDESHQQPDPPLPCQRLP